MEVNTDARTVENTDMPNPETCASLIYDCSGRSFEPEIAVKLWPTILQHKWFLSEKLGRDVGVRVACLDFVENSEALQNGFGDSERLSLLNEMGAKMVEHSVWETISESQPPKQIVNKRIILP